MKNVMNRMNRIDRDPKLNPVITKFTENHKKGITQSLTRDEFYLLAVYAFAHLHNIAGTPLEMIFCPALNKLMVVAEKASGLSEAEFHKIYTGAEVDAHILLDTLNATEKEG